MRKHNRAVNRMASSTTTRRKKNCSIKGTMRNSSSHPDSRLWTPANMQSGQARHPRLLLAKDSHSSKARQLRKSYTSPRRCTPTMRSATHRGQPGSPRQ